MTSPDRILQIRALTDLRMNNTIGGTIVVAGFCLGNLSSGSHNHNPNRKSCLKCPKRLVNKKIIRWSIIYFEIFVKKSRPLIIISELLWGPFVKSESFSLCKRVTPAMGSNLVGWFITNHEKIGKQSWPLIIRSTKNSPTCQTCSDLGNNLWWPLFNLETYLMGPTIKIQTIHYV